MVMNMYCVFDKVAEESGFSFESQNDGTAVRSMRKMQDINPEDFKLLKLGTFDHKTCKMVVKETPEEINWRSE